MTITAGRLLTMVVYNVLLRGRPARSREVTVLLLELESRCMLKYAGEVGDAVFQSFVTVIRNVNADVKYCRERLTVS